MVRRHALIVGIDRYANLDERYQLRGCVNDARAVADVLQSRHGFAADDVQLLLDAQATRSALLEAMDALVARVGDDDVVHVHFSGHGSTRSNADGSEGAGHDSTLMPHDSGRGPAPDLDILDDELRAWLDRLATRTQCVSLVFDCCHSGTLSRSATAGKVRSVPAFRAVAAGVPTHAAPTSARPPTRGLRIGSPQHVMLSACQDDEEAHESPPGEQGTPPHGALTWCLVRALTDCAAGSTWRDLFEQLAPEVRALYWNQHPQLQGRGDLELFGQCDANPIGSVVVTAVKGDGSGDAGEVTLDAGAVHGVTVGSRWQLHAPQAKQDDAGGALATVQVRALGAVSARATILECRQPPDVGMRAIAAGHATDDARTPVRIVVPEGPAGHEHAHHIEQVREALANSQLCRPAMAGEDAPFRLHLRLPGMPDASPTPAEVTQPGWALVDAGGSRVAPVHALDAPGMVERLRANVEARVRFRTLLELRNGDRASRLRGMLGLRLYRRAGPGNVDNAGDGDTWVEALPGADGEVHFRVGDGIALRITNRAPQPLFVAALDFDAQATISAVFPDDGTSALLAANTSLSVGLPADDWALEIPPLEPAGDGAPAFTGRRYETIKVFASTAAADFRMLRQEGTRAAGAPRRGWTDGEDWTTAMRSFVVDP